MKIGIDGNEANVKNRVGVSEFAYALITQFYNFRKKGEIDHNFVIYLKTKPLEHMPKEEAWFSYKIVRPKKLWTQIGLPLRLFIEKDRPDIFFSPTHYAPRFTKIPRVMSVMDLAFLLYPQTFNKDDLYQLINWTKYSVKKSKKVITISKSTKNDIISRYKVKNDKVEVIYPGVKLKTQNSKLKTEMQNSKILKDRFGIKGKYILFVSTLQPRKNVQRLIEAFSQIENSKKDLQLIIVGKKGWKYEKILKAPEKFGVEKSVKFLDFVTDDDLEVLYKNAELFVMPSLYEGFGLPILEAMKQGCPVVASNTSSLPEAGGDAAAYFNPKDTKDMAKVMNSVLKDRKKRQQMVEKGYKQVKKFSWEKSAREVLKVLEKAATN